VWVWVWVRVVRVRARGGVRSGGVRVRARRRKGGAVDMVAVAADMAGAADTEVVAVVEWSLR